MVFKRRDKRPWWKIVLEFFYPRGGWLRAAHYVRHRLRRLPDPPHKIARGIWAGLFTTFTPFYGLHFVVAAAVAFVMQGNILAALLATFFGNPLTYVPIGVVSLKTGHWLLGTEFLHDDKKIGHKFAEAGQDLWHNLTAVYTGKPADWHGLSQFYDEVFFPYMIGGLLPGIVVGTIGYYLAVPLLQAYQNRRKGRLKAKLDEIKQKRMARKSEGPGED
ncbi:MAG: DNA-directed RNA polymerase subunit omega [Rhodobacterales bacterium]|nr:MAG: DNA-directed RNA polymerase subunit omega [Rhodobacterales bacterium]